jgi:hypothetical protein
MTAADRSETEAVVTEAARPHRPAPEWMPRTSRHARIVENVALIAIAAYFVLGAIGIFA